MQFEVKAKEYSDPEKMASDYLAKYYGNQKICVQSNEYRKMLLLLIEEKGFRHLPKALLVKHMPPFRSQKTT